MRVGIDIGGSKIAAVALDERGAAAARERDDIPREYTATLGALGAVVARLEERAGHAADRISISMPGMISAEAVPIRAVNVPWLEGRPVAADLAASLGRPVRIANDANCFTLSEAVDGAAQGAAVVFGVILGSGVGGGIVVDHRPLVGANAIAGEWGHNPLPLEADCQGPAVRCGCGRLGCIETWLNGAALTRDVGETTGDALDPPEIARRAAQGDMPATAALERYTSRLALALATMINVIDPDAIVLGGGLSALPRLCDIVPKLWGEYSVPAEPRTRLVRAAHGPDSGVRGAAWL